MCGIAAALSIAGAVPVEGLRELANRLARAQAHRGPDGAGEWNDRRACALAHRRLAVIDLSPAGQQPMHDSGQRYTIVYNGELYNFNALRAELEALGRCFISRSDTEVMLAAWVQWGLDCFRRFDGMFALAIYDRLERKLVLARDSAGEKPLYYARQDGVLLVASELRALASCLPAASLELDARGVFDYLALRYVPAPRTILRDIRSLEPATVLVVSEDGSEERRAFHAFDRVVDPPATSLDEAADALENALTSSLERRLISDVPVGMFLSSGVDSSLVCALAARKLGREMRSFCAGFAGGVDDETVAARRIARALGFEHREYSVSSTDLLSLAANFGACLDEPNGDRSCVPVYLLAREMRREVTVAISGDGGDELFCGYTRYLGSDDALRRAPDPRDALELYFERALPVFPLSRLKPLFADEYAAWRDEFLSLYAPVVARPGWSGPQRLSVLDYHSYLPGAVLAKVDRMCMRHALEVRTPYLESSVMRLAAALPPELCASGQTLKPVLRRLLERHLPAGLVAERKIGFGMPQGFMQAHRAHFEAMFTEAVDALRATAFFAERSAAFQHLVSVAPGNVNSLWAFTVLGMWSQSVGLSH